MERLFELQKTLTDQFDRGKTLVEGYLNRPNQNVQSQEKFFYTFEEGLVTLQEVIIWTNPGRSLFWFIFTQLCTYQFTLSSTPILSSVAYSLLIVHIYKTVRYTIWPTIRVQPEVPEDSEGWTTLNPETLSAPEMEEIARAVIKRTKEIAYGLKLLREENHLVFSIIMSILWISLAILGTKFSTPGLVHFLVAACFLLPPALLHLSRNPQTSGIVKFLCDAVSGVSQVLVYKHNNAHLVYKELDGFIPEDEGSLENFDIGYSLGSPDNREDSLTMDLAGGMEIPSHDLEDIDPWRPGIQDSELALLQPITSEMQISDDDDLSDEDAMKNYLVKDLKDVDGIDFDTDEESL